MWRLQGSAPTGWMSGDLVRIRGHALCDKKQETRTILFIVCSLLWKIHQLHLLLLLILTFITINSSDPRLMFPVMSDLFPFFLNNVPLKCSGNISLKQTSGCLIYSVLHSDGVQYHLIRFRSGFKSTYPSTITINKWLIWQRLLLVETFLQSHIIKSQTWTWISSWDVPCTWIKNGIVCSICEVYA